MPAVYKNISSGCVKKCDMCYYLRVPLSVHKLQLFLIIPIFEIYKIHKPTTARISL